MRQLRTLLPLFLLTAWTGCGGDDAPSGLKCGPGTEERSGECLPSGGAGPDAMGGVGDEAGTRATTGGTNGGGNTAGSGALGGTNPMGGHPIAGAGDANLGGEHTGEAGAGGATCDATLDSDNANCGACGYACVGGRTCKNARCTPAWLPLSDVDAPTPRTEHAAGFVGGHYFVFGGAPTPTGKGTTSTATYDPKLDKWAIPGSHLKAARCGHAAVSTGDAILTFGGDTDCMLSYTDQPGLERYTDANGWETIAAPGEPQHRLDFSMAWTGDRLLVFGGKGVFNGYTATGAIFDPSVPGWTDATCLLQDCGRGRIYSVFWDHGVVRVWGGGDNNLDPGLTYHPDSEIWSGWGYPPGSAENLGLRFVDTGQRLIYLKQTDLVTIYDKGARKWIKDDAQMPQDFCVDAAAAWSGSELIAWSGYCNAVLSSVGGRYQPPAP